MTDFRIRKHLVHAAHHAEPRTEDGDDRNASLGDTVLPRRLERGLHVNGGEFHIPHALIGHDDGDLLDEFAELLHARVFVAQNGDLVVDQRVIEDKNIFHCAPPQDGVLTILHVSYHILNENTRIRM